MKKITVVFSHEKKLHHISISAIFQHTKSILSLICYITFFLVLPSSDWPGVFFALYFLLQRICEALFLHGVYGAAAVRASVSLPTHQFFFLLFVYF